MSSPDSDSSDFDEHGYLKARLLVQIDSIESTGSFAAFDTIDEFVNPGISVDSSTSLRLPLSVEDAHFLIQMSQQAPFGLGGQTIVDESVRKTSQIDACKIQFLNKKWMSCLESITQKAAEKLGVDCTTNVKAELHKMLIYEKGAMFKAHKDTEKISGMFGTLVICLPSAHRGGDVHLQHGDKIARFATSDSSFFDASYIAWYGDIKPVEHGYRWVLVYNLVNAEPHTEMSAKALVARVQIFRQILEQWQGLSSQPTHLIYPLAHQYTQEGLQLARLKGEDYYRVRHVAQSCAEHGGFHVLLANMELRVTDPQSEDCEEESELYLTRIVDLGGFDFSICSARRIRNTALLANIHDGRDPDNQQGGGYMGNQHAEIEQFFKDSVLVIVPDQALCNFFLGTAPSHTIFEHLMCKLREAIDVGSQLPAKQMMLRLCHDVIKDTYCDLQKKDLDLGSVAVSAMFLRDSTLFAKALETTNMGYPKHSYVSFGEMIDLQNFVVSEDNIINAIKKNGSLHGTLSNLRCLQSGFLKSNTDREDAAKTKYLQIWLDQIAYDSFVNVSNASAKDAQCLVSSVIENRDPGMKQFVLYQGARQFVDRFSDNAPFTIPAIIEILKSPANTQPFASTLLDRLLEPVITHFDLKIYASCVGPRYDWGQNACNPDPIKRLYTRVEALDSSFIPVLLTKIKTQVCNLTDTDLRAFLLPFLSDLLAILNTSSALAQDCVYILLSIYLQKIVGHEPQKPTDWSRPAEIQDCQQDCDICSQINRFLRNPKASFCWLPCENDWHFRYKFQHLKGEYIAGKKKFKLSKTSQHWEVQHRLWQGLADSALQNMGKLPQEELKKCLAKRYGDIMTLKIVKTSSSSEQGGDDQRSRSNRYCTRSTVPRKRSVHEP